METAASALQNRHALLQLPEEEERGASLDFSGRVKRLFDGHLFCQWQVARGNRCDVAGFFVRDTRIINPWLLQDRALPLKLSSSVADPRPRLRALVPKPDSEPPHRAAGPLFLMAAIRARRNLPVRRFRALNRHRPAVFGAASATTSRDQRSNGARPDPSRWLRRPGLERIRLRF